MPDSIVYPDVAFLIENRQGDGRGIIIGNNCCIYPRNRFVLGDMGQNLSAKLVVGNHVLINAGGYFSGEGGFTIHDYALIGPNVSILSAGHQFGDPSCPIRQQARFPMAKSSLEETHGSVQGRSYWRG